MDEKHKQWIEELTKDCTEGCKCHNQGVESLCKAKDVGLETFVECKEEKPFECDHSVSYGRAWYCSCHPRVYIAKVFHR